MKAQETIEKAVGYSVDGADDNWTVKCPKCDTKIEYIGYFDNEEINVCHCGCKFIITKVWLNEKQYME